jgi:hypothetical protein
MNRLRTLTTSSQDSDQPNAIRAVYEAPDQYEYYFGESSTPDGCVSGSTAWKPEGPGGSWVVAETLIEPYEWPNFRRLAGGVGRVDPATAKQFGATEATNIRLVRETELAGEPVYVIEYEFMVPSTEGPFPVTRTEWIAKITFWLLRVEHKQNDPFGFIGTTVTTLTAHDEPVDIGCRPTPTPGAGT